MNNENTGQELERGLSNRHIQLIAIGGAIGTGLFLGSGKSISLAGPSILIAYMIAGGILFLVMRALGELLISDLSYHSFVDFTKEFLGERWAFLVGWTYWFCWACVAMADLTAIGIYMDFFVPGIPGWIPGVIALVVLVLLNLLTVKLFGEIEFWFALIKIIAILALIVIGLYLIITGIQYTATNTVTGVKETVVANFSNLWSRGGLFPNGFGSFLLAFQMVVFAFAGIEMVGLTAGETADPEKTLPKAINNIPIRILIFYLGALFVIMCIYPWDVVNPEESPFVNVFKAAGITSAATIVNIVVLTSAASAGNSAVFSTSRMLYSLAQNDDAPQYFKHISGRKVPDRATIFSALIVLIAIGIQTVVPNASKVFTIIATMSTLCFMFIWTAITLSHLKYRKAKPEVSANSKFKMPFAPYSNYLILAFLAAVLVILPFDPETVKALVAMPVWFIGLLIAYQFVSKKRDAKLGIKES
ncbi:MAG: amino acid permease [Erysipelotrichales bacterium]